MILTSLEGSIVQQVIRFEFMAHNNISEYEALPVGLRLAQSLKLRNLVIYSDSQLVVKRVLGEYEAHKAHLQAYF